MNLDNILADLIAKFPEVSEDELFELMEVVLEDDEELTIDEFFQRIQFMVNGTITGD